MLSAGAHAYNPITQELEAGRVQGQPQLHKLSWAVTAHAFEVSTHRHRQAGLGELEASLLYLYSQFQDSQGYKDKLFLEEGEFGGHVRHCLKHRHAQETGEGEREKRLAVGRSQPVSGGHS